MLTILIITPSCNGKMTKKISWALGKTPQINSQPPPGPPEYQKGYIDGCEMALQENENNLFARAVFRGAAAHDPAFMHLPLYRNAFKNAYLYCALAGGYTARNAGYWWTASWSLKPKYIKGSEKYKMLNAAPDGPPNFRYGWKHGCATGKASTGRTHDRLRYRFTQDYRYALNKEYSRGWSVAFWWCLRYYDIYTSSARKGIL